VRLVGVALREVGSVAAPFRLELGRDLTALVGPNGAGTTTVARALAAACDEAVSPPWEGADRPVGSDPEVVLTFRGRVDGADLELERTVTWRAGGRLVADSRSVPDVCAPPARVVAAPVGCTPPALLARHATLLTEVGLGAADLGAPLTEAVAVVLPHVAGVVVEGPLDDPSVTVLDGAGGPLLSTTGSRSRPLAEAVLVAGGELAAVVVEEPEASLHPAAQEVLRGLLGRLAVEADAPVLVTARSPFALPRGADDRVVALARDDTGRTHVVGTAAGDEPHAPLLGGLLRDPGLGGVLDRAATLPAGTRGVLLVEGGTDEAYLRIAAAALGREADLDGIHVQPAGGAMAVALQAIVLRAESDLPLLALLDDDEQGRRGRDTLRSRFGFDRRRQVTSYGEFVPDHPSGTEAEDMFDHRLVARFVAEQGPRSVRAVWELRRGPDGPELHHDLTPAAKSAFVGWVRAHATAADVPRWGLLLDALQDRLVPPTAPDPDGGTT
jgi:hypothetical protein